MLVFQLLRINTAVNYDTAWVDFKRKSVYNWMKAVGADEILIFDELRLEATGVYTFRFHVPDSKEAKWTQFSKLYNTRNKRTFTDDLFYKLNYIFRLPPEYMVLKMNYSYEGLYGDITYNKGELSYAFMQLTSARTRTKLKKEDVHKLLASFVQSSSKKVDARMKHVDTFEKMIYECLVKYFESKKVDIDENLQKIKVEDNKVIAYANNVRREILKNEQYWENVGYDFSITDDADKVVIDLKVDGEYGTGIVIGNIGRPPSYKGYESDEPKFKKELQRYTSDILYKLIDILNQKL
jgi:hypothetical protein